MKTITSDQLERLAENDKDLAYQLETDFYGFLLVYALWKSNKPMDLNGVAEFIRNHLYQSIHPSLKFLYVTENGEERGEEQWHRRLQLKISSHWDQDASLFLRKVVSRSKVGKSYLYQLSENARYFLSDFLSRNVGVINIGHPNSTDDVAFVGTKDQPSFIIFYGPPGTGKTNMVKEHYLGSMDEDYFHIVQIHPSYSYEDLVEGIKPVTFFDGEVKYEIVNGPIKVMSHKANGEPVSLLCCVDEQGGLHFPLGTQAKYKFNRVLVSSSSKLEKPVELVVENDHVANYCPKKTDAQPGFKLFIKLFVKGVNWGMSKYAILLDEINRGHVASILGELVFAIGEAQSEKPKGVSLQYSNETFKWPQNLSLLATMNTADTTTDKIDQAIKRRFNLVKVNPFSTEREWVENIKLSCMQETHPGKDLKFYFKIIFEANAELFYPWNMLNEINEKLESEGRKYGAISIEEKLIGHSYFISYCRKVIQYYNDNQKDLSPKDYQDYGRKILRKILVEEIFPVLVNIFNNNNEKADAFIQDHLIQAGAFNSVADSLDKLIQDYEVDEAA
jgi:DNA polymerase III delta prime subunit